MASTSGEVLLQWFTCCYNHQPVQRKRRRIDRSMIGNPTDFQHTVHIGTNEIEMPNHLMTAVQNQMQSKGGYDMSYTVKAY